MSGFNRVALAALAFSVSFGAAQAQGLSYSIESSLTNIQYTLTDLRPDDGMDASVGFSNIGTNAFLGGVAVVDDLVSGNQIGYDSQDSAELDTAYPFGTMAATNFTLPDNTSAGAFVEGNHLATSIRLTQIGQGYYAEAAAAAINIDLESDNPPEPIQNTVILAPHSQFTLTGMAKFGLVPLGEGNCQDCGLFVEAHSLLISSELFPEFFDPSSESELLFESSGRVEGLYDSFGINEYFEQGLSENLHQSKEISLTFVNNTDEFKRFGFIATTWVQAQTFQASPVPEPATWGLMLTGLLLLGSAARRRQR
ncbi:MAG: hypothetical protein A2711_10520 [Burkholderiales bacterium RIFCSPHIGHO2_01_FULL_63_240]|jgi:hypothetical protein|nr:MAG: hypothetical protein A2711_10520 [Burkholderiales bacterium RIFCSPHIGHO2_01_FULL_63_240]